MARHLDGKKKKRGGPGDETAEIIDLNAYLEETEREPEVTVEYEDDESPEEAERRKAPKALYRVVVILLVLAVGLALWINRDKLDPQSLSLWIRTQFTGESAGDGFPVALTGSQVAGANFTVENGNALVLSDTALTMLDRTGKELLSLRHSLSQPVLRSAGSRCLLYDAGGTGYLTLSGTQTQAEGTADREIITGAVARNGRFALAARGADGASALRVYQADGSLQFEYLFAQDYVTALALNYDGSCGMACTVRTEDGELVSRVTVFDFNQPEPLARAETRDNLLLDACWTESGDLFALGDSALLTARSADYAFGEYDYGGRQPTAYCFAQNRVFLSISAYSHAGPCTLLVFRGQGEPLRVESDSRILSLSASGGTVGALVNGQAVFYDHSSGAETGRAAVSGDARAIALLSESAAYALGVSEVRLLELR